MSNATATTDNVPRKMAVLMDSGYNNSVSRGPDANGGIEWDVKDCMQSRQDYIIAVKEEEIRDARKIAQGMRQRARSHAELGGEAVWVGDTLATRAEFQGLLRKVVLVRRRGGRCGDGDTAP